MTANTLIHQEFSSAGRSRAFHHDANVLVRILEYFFGATNKTTHEAATHPFDAQDVDALRRSLEATYVGGRTTEGTHGSVRTLTYDWLLALESSKSVEDVIRASIGRLNATIIERLRELRAYDLTYVRGRRPMSANSLKHAVRFLVTYQMPTPRITETLSGDLLLEWNKSKYAYLCVQFVDELAFFLLIDGSNRMKGRLSTGEWSNGLPLDIIRSWFL
jgi:hypothetical protein